MAEEEQEMSIEEVVEENNILLNTLIDHLIEKNVISEDEFLNKLNAVNSEVQEKENESAEEAVQNAETNESEESKD
ncbi:MAG: hypothetical protein ACOCQG_06410 [Candidatus Nanoarchaeia archaeon]